MRRESVRVFISSSVGNTGAGAGTEVDGFGRKRKAFQVHVGSGLFISYFVYPLRTMGSVAAPTYCAARVSADGGR